MSIPIPARERPPAYHYDSAPSRAILEVLEDGSLAAGAAAVDTAEQIFPETATWGLVLWEEALGIFGAQGDALELRRRQVAAKLRGLGATTAGTVKAVAETALGVPVEVRELFGQYRVELIPDSGGRLPDGAVQLRQRMNAIMPAHLDWALVVPILVQVGIGQAMGPRRSTAGVRVREKYPPGGKIPCAVRCGGPISYTQLPYAAAQEGASWVIPTA